MEYRCSNFNAGPSALPLDILERVQRELLNFEGTGCSIMETSHRSSTFQKVMDQATHSYKTLFDLPDTHDIVFSQGGGTGQTAAILYNSVKQDSEWAAYAVNGTWSKKALEEADKLQYRRGVIAEPSPASLLCPSQWGNAGSIDEFAEDCCHLPSSPPALIYHCNNETIHGLEYHQDPRDLASPNLPPSWDPAKIVWAMDASSNFCSKPIKIQNYDIIYAGAQKNVGTSGITISLLNKTKIQTPKNPCPSIFDYSILMKNKSLHTTIPVFPMYITGLVAQQLVEQGGLSAAEERAIKNSDLLYQAIDSSDGFFKCPVVNSSRSRMNHVFRIYGPRDQQQTGPREDLEKLFVEEAIKNGMIGLKGHRSIGGLRASLYNAVTASDVTKLVDFMSAFQDKHTQC